MGNRVMQGKDLKRKRRGRFAKFSGATSKFASALSTTKVTVEYRGGKREHFLEVPVGKISLSRQSINTGRGPDPQRMAVYYHNDKTFQIPVHQKTHVLEEFEHIVNEAPKQNRICLEHDDLAGSLWLFWEDRRYFFVEVDPHSRTMKRSRDYNGRRSAMDRFVNKRIIWSSSLPFDPLLLPG